jgi:succinyl-CoA synthetase beta subunit
VGGAPAATGATAASGATAAASGATDDLDAGGYAAARSLLAAAGVPFADARTVTSAAEAVAAAAALGYPVVLKALGTLHKSDAGGVALGLRDDAALTAAFDDMARRLAPPAFTVERMAPLADGVELLIGARWDARFGPIALVGMGGLYTEILADAAVALAPVDEARARALIASLRAAPLLQGARGRPHLDVGAAAAALAALSRVAAEHPELAAIEVNPLLVLPSGALGLDARLEPA